MKLPVLKQKQEFQKLCQTATFATNYTPGNKAAGTSLIKFNALGD